MAVSLGLASSWLVGLPAAAHSELLASVPAAGAEVAEPPVSVELAFTDPLSGASTVDVLDAGFRSVALGRAVVDPELTNTVSVVLGELPPGDYTVQYHAVEAVDGHAVDGSFGFRVLGADAVPTPTRAEPAVVMAAAPTSAPANPATGSAVVAQSGTRLAVGVLVGVLALTALARAARRRPTIGRGAGA